MKAGVGVGRGQPAVNGSSATPHAHLTYLPKKSTDRKTYIPNWGYLPFRVRKAALSVPSGSRVKAAPRLCLTYPARLRRTPF